jgi:pantothenate kinase
VRFTSLADVAAAIRPGITGIIGAPGAGKSTIGVALVDLLPDAVLLPMDGYHLPQAELVRLGRRDRMGAPDTFDVDGFVATLTAVRAAAAGAAASGAAFGAAPGAASGAASGAAFGNSGVTVFAPGFDRAIEEAVPDAIALSPEFPKVIVEGNYLLLETLGWDRVAPLLDVSFFVEVDPGIRRQRLIDRHIRFGKSPADAAAWALGPDEANARLIKATAPRADHTIAF